MKQTVPPSDWYIPVSDPASLLRLLVVNNRTMSVLVEFMLSRRTRLRRGGRDCRNAKGNEQLHTLPSILLPFAHDSKITSGWLSLAYKPTPLNTLGRKEAIYYFTKQEVLK